MNFTEHNVKITLPKFNSSTLKNGGFMEDKPFPVGLKVTFRGGGGVVLSDLETSNF